eukprot:gene4341-5532_t
MPEAVASRSIGNPAVAQAMLVAPDTLYVAGVDIGSTNMVVQGKSGKCSLIDLVVGMDVAGLQAALAQLMPHEKNIRVTAAADALVLSGTVEDGATLMNVLELAHAYVRRPVQALASPRLPEDKVEGAWARATVQGQKGTGAFMKLTAPEGAKLVGASSPAAGVTEVHEMKMEGDVMKMRAVPVLDLPAGKTVELKPGGTRRILAGPGGRAPGFAG